MQFLDKTRIKIISGRGGNGMVAWRREKYVDKGGPAGGDGGSGGDVYLIADENMSTLMDFKYKSVFKAESGENGSIKNMHGKCAKDLVIKVPVGTVVRDLKTGNAIADLTEHEQKVLVAKGGRGGRGNARFATAQKRAPQFCEPGEPGIERELELELKLIADVGLLGMPNAGKSTLISRISSAKPKIADYPFTTLNPNLGITLHKGLSFATADIPGIIEGASEGKGLGHQFLKHIERTRVLLHLVDPDGFDGMDALESVKVIERELKQFDKELAQKPRIIAVNKADLPSSQKSYEQIKKKYKKYPVMLMSAATGQGVKEVLDEVVQILSVTPVPVVAAKEPQAALHKVEPIFVIDKDEEGIIHITGKKIGLEKALLKAGVQDGDPLIAGGREFEWNGTLDKEAAENPEHVGYKRRETKAERLAKRVARRKAKEEK